MQEVLQFLNAQKEKLKELESAGERIVELEEKIKDLEEKQKKSAALLTRTRKKAAPELEKKIEIEFQWLFPPFYGPVVDEVVVDNEEAAVAPAKSEAVDEPPPLSSLEIPRSNKSSIA